jgi:hypothetical protein
VASDITDPCDLFTDLDFIMNLDGTLSPRTVRSGLGSVQHVLGARSIRLKVAEAGLLELEPWREAEHQGDL